MFNGQVVSLLVHKSENGDLRKRGWELGENIQIYQLFLSQRCEIFILGVPGFLKTM